MTTAAVQQLDPLPVQPPQVTSDTPAYWTNRDGERSTPMAAFRALGLGLLVKINSLEDEPPVGILRPEIGAGVQVEGKTWHAYPFEDRRKDRIIALFPYQIDNWINCSMAILGHPKDDFTGKHLVKIEAPASPALDRYWRANPRSPCVLIEPSWIQHGYEWGQGRCDEEAEWDKAERVRVDKDLIQAVKTGSTHLARHALDQGADPNARDELTEGTKHCALHLAALHDSDRMIELLLEKGANIDHLNQADWSPLHVAIYYGKVHAVKALLSQGANVQRVARWTAWELAQDVMFTLKGHARCVEKLIRNVEIRRALVDLRQTNKEARGKRLSVSH